MYSPEAQISLHFALRPSIFEIQVCRKLECTEWPQNYLKHFTDKSYLVHTEYSPPNPIFCSVLLYDQPFSRYKIIKKVNALNDSGMTLSTQLSKVPCIHSIRAPKTQFHFISLKSQPFSRYKVDENRKCTEWPQIDLNPLTVKGTLYVLNTHPRGLNLNPLRSTARHFRHTSLPKIRNTPNDPRITLTT